MPVIANASQVFGAALVKINIYKYINCLKHFYRSISMAIACNLCGHNPDLVINSVKIPSVRQFLHESGQIDSVFFQFNEPDHTP